MSVALFLFSAGLFYISFPNVVWLQGASWCAWGCALPFFYALDGKDLRARFLLGLAWGVLTHGLLVSWLIPLSLGGWLILTLALATQGVVFAVLFPAGVAPCVLKFLLIPCAWVASEWLRAFLLGGFSWSLGYSQSGMPELIQAASWGGVYAVAWVVMAINAAIYLGVVVKDPAQAWRPGVQGRFLVSGAIIFMLFFLGGALRMDLAFSAPQIMRVAAIQPNILRDEKTRDDLYDAHAARHFMLTKKAVMAGKMGLDDLVVWPETAFTDDILTDLKWRPRLEQAARNLQVNMLIGSALLWEGRDFNSAIFLSSDGIWKSVYHKMRLVPLAEFTPALAEGIVRYLGVGQYHFSPGSRPGSMAMPRGVKFGVTICSEEFYPKMFRDLAQAQARFSVVMLNDGWFERRDALWQHALVSPLRAVESGLPLVRAANTGRTCAFDGYGRPLGRALDAQRPDVAVYLVPLASGNTFYARWGDVFALACGVFVIIYYAGCLMGCGIAALRVGKLSEK